MKCTEHAGPVIEDFKEKLWIEDSIKHVDNSMEIKTLITYNSTRNTIQ